MELFYYQAEHNPVYRQYLHYLGISPLKIKRLEDIPYLPIRFFKTQAVKTGEFEPEVVFSSSGTSGSVASLHQVRDMAVYEESFIKAFRLFFGEPERYFFAALLPSYLERSGSSLITMCQRFIALSRDEESGFFLNEYESLYNLLQSKIAQKVPVFLIGVSFGLLEFAERYQLQLDEGDVVMETGGMKGRRREMTREELHAAMANGIRTKQIASEYGMTELLSQAYARQGGYFETPPWMGIRIRDTDDPFAGRPVGKTGGINVMDLANFDSCAFIETEDLGRLHSSGRFEVLGRFDNSDIRGCNLLAF